MEFVFIAILAILMLSMMMPMSMMEIPARAWVRVASVVKRRR